MVCCANADTSDHSNYTLIPLYEQISQTTNSLLVPSHEITADDLQSLIILAEKYFLTREQYEQPIYQKMQCDYVLHRYRGYAIYDEPQPTVEKALLNVLQKYFHESPSVSQHLEDAVKLRDILRHVQAMDHGRLSGRVWLHHSSFPVFAHRYLPQIDEQIIQTSLRKATTARKKHQYSNAQKIYKRLLQDYNDTPYAASIKVLLDKAIVEDYHNRAKLAFAKHDYKKGRAALQWLVASYPDTDIATKALADLQKMVSRAVITNKKAGDSHYKANTQYGVPQKEAAIFYRRTYEADPEGPQAAYALYWWSRALVTEGKYDVAIEKLKRLLHQFPDSEIISQATYSLGFDYMISNDYHKAKILFQKVVQDFPNGEQAPEALWQMAIQDAVRSHFSQALQSMQMLHDRYPKSPRWRHTAKWLEVLKEKIRTGGTWP